MNWKQGKIKHWSVKKLMISELDVYIVQVLKISVIQSNIRALPRIDSGAPM